MEMVVVMGVSMELNFEMFAFQQAACESSPFQAWPPIWVAAESGGGGSLSVSVGEGTTGYRVHR